jgi:hypothetical protein
MEVEAVLSRLVGALRSVILSPLLPLNSDRSGRHLLPLVRAQPCLSTRTTHGIGSPILSLRVTEKILQPSVC